MSDKGESVGIARAAEQHIRARQFHLAEKLLLHAVSHDGDFAEAYNLIGVVFAKTARGDRAIEAFQRAHSLNPADYGFARNLTVTLCRRQRFDEASALARRYLEISRDGADDLAQIVSRHLGETEAQHSEVFNEIYRRNAWNAGSGFGSSRKRRARTGYFCRGSWAGTVSGR